MRSSSPTMRRTTPYTCTKWIIAAKILRKALPCTDGQRDAKNFYRHADLGHDSSQRAFHLSRFADPTRGTRIFLRRTFHDALLADAGRRAHGNSSGTERSAQIRDVFRAADRSCLCGEPGIHSGLWIRDRKSVV